MVENKFSHGTLCTYIIQEIYENIVILDIQVLDKFGTGTIEKLITALLWCEAQGIKLIHMSLCTCNYHDYCRLQPLIERMIKKRCIFVASWDNRNIKSFPATIPGVFGVRQSKDSRLSNGGYGFEVCDNLRIENCMVAHFEGELNCENNKKNLGLTNSFAAPVVTGYIAKVLDAQGDIGLEEMITLLKNNSTYIDCKNIKMLHFFKYKKKDISVPIIYLSGCEYLLVYKLFQILKKKGHYAEFFSDKHRIEGIIPVQFYCDKINNIDPKLILIWQQVYQADLFVFCQNNEIDCGMSTVLQMSDIIITQDGDSILMQTNHSTVRYTNIKKLYNGILSHFM